MIELENGTTVVMTYDSTHGRLEALTNYASNGTTAMNSFEYTYNLDGYVTEVERENGDTVTHGYDDVGRPASPYRPSCVRIVSTTPFGG